MSRRFFELGEPNRKYFNDPAVALARPIPAKTAFVYDASIRSLDVVDRHMLLHVGYQVSPCGKWILAMCVDERGETHQQGVWAVQTEQLQSQIAKQIWSFAVQFARQASIEWRIVIAKLGFMSSAELEGDYIFDFCATETDQFISAWTLHLSVVVPRCEEIPMMSVNLLCVDTTSPWTFVTPSPSIVSSDEPPPDSGFFVDNSFTTCAIFPTTSASIYPRHIQHGPLAKFIREGTEPANLPSIMPISTTILARIPADASLSSTTMIHLHLLHTIKSPHSSLTTTDWETHKAITRNYHDLAVLAKVRRRTQDFNPILPFHLAALEIMYSGLRPS